MRYELQESGIYLDTKTGRFWHPEQAKVSNDGWADAYAASLDTAGLKWRVPAIEELEAIVNFSRRKPKSSLPGMIADCYWSSSVDMDLNDSGWFTQFATGWRGRSSLAHIYHVRCVAGPLAHTSREART